VWVERLSSTTWMSEVCLTKCTKLGV
jgi:hypothetical protein